jgi:large subunit ribosomal protein L6
MSRIGRQPVIIPSGVTVSLTRDMITVKSAQAELSQALPPQIKVKMEADKIICSNPVSTPKTDALFGLVRSLINNLVLGVTKGFRKTMEIQGTGFRVKPAATGLEFSLGFSHPVKFPAPPGIKLEIKENKFIVVSGADKYLVGQTAARLRDLKKPDVYKGKGIRYQGEVVKLKPGKAVKAAAA